ncbi:MAG: alpha/beta hydrolase [Parvibaculales bacterium]
MRCEMIIDDLALHGRSCAVDDAPIFHWAHANGYSGRTYDSMLRPISDKMTVYAWDARGHGHTKLTANPNQHQDWYLYRDDMIAMLEVLVARHNQKIILGGHSMGATTSLLVAAERPDLVRALVLADPVAFPKFFLWLEKIFRSLTGRSAEAKLVEGALNRKSIFKSQEEIWQRYHGRASFRSWDDAFLQDYIKHATLPATDETGTQVLQLACAPAWEAANFSAQGHDTYAALAKLVTPYVILRGEKGSTVFHYRPFQKHAECISHEIVAGSSHFLPMEQPQVIIKTIFEKLLPALA